MTHPIQTERDIQRGIRKWLAAHGILSWAVPNGAHLSGTKLQRIKQMSALKADGLMNGAPDLTLVSKTGGVGFLEVKSATGPVSNDQKHLHRVLSDRGVPVAIVRSIDDTKAALQAWCWL
ncbi:MAG: VRR-NUC domain-containing protein [Shewanella sp.]